MNASNRHLASNCLFSSTLNLNNPHNLYSRWKSAPVAFIEETIQEHSLKDCVDKDGYVHMEILKPFSYLHGESTFEKYTETKNLNTALIHDPDGYIHWENGADIQVKYAVPDNTWDDYVELRVLTGRDFDVEGLAVLNHECAILGDELMPAIFAVNPTTGVVKSSFVRTPDIDKDGSFKIDPTLTNMCDHSNRHPPLLSSKQHMP